jgi:hypothetical protein
MARLRARPPTASIQPGGHTGKVVFSDDDVRDPLIDRMTISSGTGIQPDLDSPQHRP